MSRKLNKLKILWYDIKEFFSKDNLFVNIFPKVCPSCKLWKSYYYKLLEDYCTITYEVTDGILSYKHYRPEDILSLDDERINRLNYDFLITELEFLLDESKDCKNKKQIINIIKKYIDENKDNYETYKKW